MLIRRRRLRFYQWPRPTCSGRPWARRTSRSWPSRRRSFVAGAAARGTPREKAAELWEYIEPFAGYGFNKSQAWPTPCWPTRRRI